MIEKFYCFGDSISFGQHISVHNTWVSKLSNFLEIEFPEKNIILNNFSICGNTTEMALDRFGNDITRYSPHYVLVQFGLNDCNFWLDGGGKPRVSLNDFYNNMGDILDKLILNKVKIIYLCTFHPTNKGLILIGGKKFQYDKIQKAYSNKIKDLFENYKKQSQIILLDIEKYFENKRNVNKKKLHLLDDGIHLSQYGHEAYFKFISPIVKKSLKY